MRISHKHKLIFLSNPKTGSISIRNIMERNTDVFSKDEYPFYHHISAYELKQVFAQKGWNWEEYTKFTLVRNPWDRAVSNYKYAKPDKNFLPWYHEKYNASSAFSPSFKEWLKKVLSASYSEEVYWDASKDSNKPFLLNSFQMMPSLKWFCEDLNGNCLVDIIFKTEEMEKQLPDFFKTHGIEVDAIPMDNASYYKEGEQYHDEETIDIITEHYASEIQTYGYTGPSTNTIRKERTKVLTQYLLEKDRKMVAEVSKLDGIIKDTNSKLQAVYVEKNEQVAQLNKVIEDLYVEKNEQVAQLNKVIEDLYVEKNEQVAQLNKAIEDLYVEKNEQVAQLNKVIEDLYVEKNEQVAQLNKVIENLYVEKNEQVAQLNFSIENIIQEKHEQIILVRQINSKLSEVYKEKNVMVNKLNAGIANHIKEKNQLRKKLRGQIRQMQTQLHKTSQYAEERNREIGNLHNSISWKIGRVFVKPIDIIVQLFKREKSL